MITPDLADMECCIQNCVQGVTPDLCEKIGNTMICLEQFQNESWAWEGGTFLKDQALTKK